MLSQTALQAVLSSSTEAVFLDCITIDHPDLGTPLRLVNDKKDLERTAGTFSKFNFEVRGVTQRKNQLPSMKIRLGNIDQRVIETIRPLAGTRDDITFTYEMVLHETPNTVEYGPIDFRVEQVSVTLQTIDFELSFHEGLLNAAFPFLQFAPSNAG